MRMSAGNIKPTKKTSTKNVSQSFNNSLGVNHQSNSTSNILSAQATVKSVQNMPSRPSGETTQL